MKAQNLKIEINSNGEVEIKLTLPNAKRLDRLYEFSKLNKDLDVNIDIYRKKRSLDANAYMWVLLQKMADALCTNKQDLYIDCLVRYGVFIHVLLPKDALESFKNEYRACRVIAERVYRGKESIVLQCYYGSSTYNSKEMSQLINGIVDEAKELGIETETPEEIQRLIDMIGE